MGASDFLGRFVWYDLMTTDEEAAQKFYREVIGWNTQAWEGSPSPYTMFTAGEGPVGGSMALPEEARAMGAPPHWLAYTATPDIDATVAKATELGAEVLMPIEEIRSSVSLLSGLIRYPCPLLPNSSLMTSMAPLPSTPMADRT